MNAVVVLCVVLNVVVVDLLVPVLLVVTVPCEVVNVVVVDLLDAVLLLVCVACVAVSYTHLTLPTKA